jgi:hypothetical protein
VEARERLILETLAETGQSLVPGPESARACRELMAAGYVEQTTRAVYMCVSITPKGERALLATQMFGGQDD